MSSRESWKQTVLLCTTVWEDQATMWTLAATVHSLLAAALLLACCLQSLMATEDDVTPRISFPYSKSKIITWHGFVCFATYNTSVITVSLTPSPNTASNHVLKLHATFIFLFSLKVKHASQKNSEQWSTNLTSVLLIQVFKMSIYTEMKPH